MYKNNAKIHEADIRPDNLMVGQKQAMAADIRRLKSKKGKFVAVACPACGYKKYTRKFAKYGMKFVECLKCKTYYTNPRPTSAVLEWFYKDSVNYGYWNKYIFPASEKARRKKIFAPRVNLVLDLCKKFKVKTSSLLEIGAGHGTFCSEMLSRKVFKNIVAVEPVASLAETCESKGIETINKPIEETRFKKNELFDVAVNFEVMEHLFSPKEFILSCKRALKQGGLFIFTLPNGQGFDVSALGVLSDTIDHEHLNYFNPKSIKILINKCGLEVIDILTPGKLDAELVRKKVISGELDISKQPFLQRILIDEWERLGADFQEFIAQHKLSSHMMVVAKKASKKL